MKGAARKAPPGFIWRPSLLPHLPQVFILERESDGDMRGSIGPAKRGQWMNRETGELFATREDAQASVETYV